MNTQENRDENVPVCKVDLDEATDKSTSCVVVRSVADLTDQDPEDLEPLWNSVDPEALDSFVAHASDSSTPSQLSFRYQGYTVEVVENRWLRFTPNEESGPAGSA